MVQPHATNASRKGEIGMSPTSKMLRPFLGCALVFAAATASAQSALSCPQLPVSSNLNWEQRGNDEFLICSAVATDGSEVFGVSLSAKPAFQPKRSNREEKGVIADQNIRWYRAEVATQPDILVRETLVELGQDRFAHIWMRTPSEEALLERMLLVERLDFDDMRVSSN
ncbi:MAG TPA: hypothetical protein H9827_01065 [Candidatus Luteimonas excrementigallinarum]|nr:hypothetical protein [Candidatus Luteimonas excrementigallinarum]